MKIVKEFCDKCGNEIEEGKAEIFTKKLPPYLTLQVHLCPECYNKMFEKQIKRSEELMNDHSKDKKGK